MTRAIDAAPDTQKDDVNLTPMLDVVFILLIFFVVTATFVKEAGIDVNRPEAKTTDPVPNAGILIAISADDQIWIDGRSVDARALRANIERLHAENPKGGVVIQADGQSTNNRFVQVMDAARQAGIDDIAIATDGKKR